MTTIIRRANVLLVVLSTLLLAATILFSPFSNSAYAAKASKGEQIASFARTLEGKPYKYGGTTVKGFDASGFTQYVYKQAVNATLPRTIDQQYKNKNAVSVPQKKLQPGDLVFFKLDGKNVSFAGIYLGKDQFIAATTKGVKVQSLSTKYWKSTYADAKRVVK
ncbi:C40 family peptidase [Fictibacillus sp. Mic-4]|uniref:C40 family peptidase n=1 Tax=Fictibacillus TaxID=1329200 RepID=UPI00041B1B89|nr:C40 family peptidase [Fictibacillus gelatini]